MIEDILPRTKPRMRILRAIYENPGINVSELIKKTRTSPNLVIEYVDSLTQHGIVSEDRIGGKKKTHIRCLKADLSSETAVLLLSMVEIDKRLLFLKKYKRLKPVFHQLRDLLKGSDTFCLIYGSFARMSADKDSDLDVWLVGRISPQARKTLSEIFSTLEMEFSVKIETPEQFIKNISNPLHQNMLREHIIVYNEKGYLKAIS